MIPYEFDAERFSRWIAYVLRHNPSRYGLQADRHGYVDLAEFLRIAQRRYPEVAAERLRELLASSSPERFEIAENRLRARYGHSIPVEPVGAAIEPPETLYHGTEPERRIAILSDGLVPQDRQLVHLSATMEDALAVARRRTEQPLILRVLARQAHQAGIAFYREGKLYLAHHIPSAFLVLPTPL